MIAFADTRILASRAIPIAPILLLAAVVGLGWASLAISVAYYYDAVPRGYDRVAQPVATVSLDPQGFSGPAVSGRRGASLLPRFPAAKGGAAPVLKG